MWSPVLSPAGPFQPLWSCSLHPRGLGQGRQGSESSPPPSRPPCTLLQWSPRRSHQALLQPLPGSRTLPCMRLPRTLPARFCPAALAHWCCGPRTVLCMQLAPLRAARAWRSPSGDSLDAGTSEAVGALRSAPGSFPEKRPEPSLLASVSVRLCVINLFGTTCSGGFLWAGGDDGWDECGRKGMGRLASAGPRRVAGPQQQPAASSELGDSP